MTAPTPPTIHFLKEDPVFWKMMRTIPLLSPGIRAGKPWMVWVHTQQGKWRRTAPVHEYREAYVSMKKFMADERYRDVALVCRPTFFRPPPAMVWEDPPFEWCGRCRRPTFYSNAGPEHHAMRDIPYASQAARCFYCGINQFTMPRYDRTVA